MKRVLLALLAALALGACTDQATTDTGDDRQERQERREQRQERKSARALEIVDRMAARMEAVQKTSRAGARAANSGDVAGVCRANERLQRMVRANGRDVRRLQRFDAPAVREHMSQVLARPSSSSGPRA